MTVKSKDVTPEGGQVYMQNKRLDGKVIRVKKYNPFPLDTYMGFCITSPERSCGDKCLHIGL